MGVSYDGGACDSAEGVVEGQVVVLYGDVVEGTVLAFAQPGGMGEKLLSVEGEWNHCLGRGVHAIIITFS